MSKPDTEPIRKSINALGVETAPDSVTPARVAGLLQAIVDLINALSTVPDTEVTNIMATINSALSTAQAAAATANTALTNANSKLLSQFKADAAGSGVTLTVKQVGHEPISFAFPIANASQAGIVLPSVLQSISDAAGAARKNRLSNITKQYGAGIILTFKDADGAAMVTYTIPLATANTHGLMAAVDKNKLDSLPSSGIVALDSAGRVPAAHAPQVMLRNITGGAPDDLHNGDFYFDQGDGHIYAVPDINDEPIDMGTPSKNVVYCYVDTNILYRWTGSGFVPVRTDPNHAMDIVEVRRNNNTQKIYAIPNGKLAKVIPTTDVVNISLTPAENGASVHRIVMYASDFQNTADINWPDSLWWKDNDELQGQTVTDNRGVVVTIYDMKFAEYNTYGR